MSFPVTVSDRVKFFHHNTRHVLLKSSLIVDDQLANVQLLERMLHSAGYTDVSSTTSSREVCSLHGKHRYNLILLDLNMPDMSGFDVLAQLRRDPEFAEIPIVVALTNSDNSRDRERIIQLGANGFRTKDADLNDYIAFFNSLAG